MRRLIVSLLACFCAASHASAEPVRVTTWKLSSLPVGPAASASTDVEQKRLREAAVVLKSVNSDVILLQGVRDRESCVRLAEFLRPATYYVLACSAFQDGSGGPQSRGQVAILSKRPAFGAWPEHWRKEGSVEPPGGFAFAAIRFGAVDVAFYSIQLKDNQTRGNNERETQLNILKREICARQLASHVAAVEGKITNPTKGFVIAGDFNTSPDQDLFITESTLGVLEESGFRNVFHNTPPVNRITRPAAGRLPDATFDYILAKNAAFTRAVRINSARVSDRLPLTCDLAVPAAPPAAERSPLPILGVTPAELVRRKVIWLGAGAFAFLLVIGMTVLRARRANRSAPGIALTQFADAYTSQGNSRASLANHSMRSGNGPSEALSTADETGDVESTFWQKRALKAERRAEHATTVVRAGLLPHLARMLKDRLLWKLITQRSQLLQTQHTSERLMAEFEQRLTGIQSQFQTRLRSYERRIAELETVIAARDLELVRMKEAALGETQEIVAPTWPPLFKS